MRNKTWTSSSYYHYQEVILFERLKRIVCLYLLCLIMYCSFKSFSTISHTWYRMHVRYKYWILKITHTAWLLVWKSKLRFLFLFIHVCMDTCKLMVPIFYHATKKGISFYFNLLILMLFLLISVIIYISVKSFRI